MKNHTSDSFFCYIMCFCTCKLLLVIATSFRNTPLSLSTEKREYRKVDSAHVKTAKTEWQIMGTECCPKHSDKSLSWLVMFVDGGDSGTMAVAYLMNGYNGSSDVHKTLEPHQWGCEYPYWKNFVHWRFYRCLVADHEKKHHLECCKHWVICNKLVQSLATLESSLPLECYN